MTTTQDLYERVRQSLERVRPYLQTDGGDVELLRVTEYGFVEVKLIGACANCPMSVLTLRAGIERALLRDVPEVRRVESVLQ